MPTKESEETEVENPIPAPKYDEDEDWVKEHKKQFGEEPSFF